MKTKTETQLEKEIEDLKKGLNIPATKHTGNITKPVKVHFNYKPEIIKIAKAKLSQHKTDIKNFEKLISDLRYNSNDLLEYKKRIKEALKEL